MDTEISQSLAVRNVASQRHKFHRVHPLHGVLEAMTRGHMLIYGAIAGVAADNALETEHVVSVVEL